MSRRSKENMDYIVILHSNRQIVRLTADDLILNEYSSFTWDDWERLTETVVTCKAMYDGDVHECSLLQVVDCTIDTRDVISRLSEFASKKNLCVSSMLRMIPRTRTLGGKRMKLQPLALIDTESETDMHPVQGSSVERKFVDEPSLPALIPKKASHASLPHLAPLSVLNENSQGSSYIKVVNEQQSPSPSICKKPVMSPNTPVTTSGALLKMMVDMRYEMRQKFQELNERLDKIENMSLNTTSCPDPNTFVQAADIASLDTMKQDVLQPDKKVKLIRWLSWCGGESVKDCVRRMMNKLMVNDVQRLVNRTGKQGKEGLGILEDCVLDSEKD